MIKVERTKVTGFEPAIRGMRNPFNSWDKSDSVWVKNDKCVVGKNDLLLMKKLFKAGTDHRKFMRMIVVYMDITAPLYWWKEFETYRIGVERPDLVECNSCSTMHKIHSKPFCLGDFSHEHLTQSNLGVLEQTIARLNNERLLFESTKSKDHWWQIIQLLPNSYNQKRTIMLNYEALANMYFSRSSHKLEEWILLCETIRGLPYFEEICGGY